MAKVKITWTERKDCEKIVDIPFPEDYGDFDIESEYDLEEVFKDHINWNDDDTFLYNYLSDDEQKNCYKDLEGEIVDRADFFEECSHFIKIPEKIKEPYNCCSQYVTNYCPECGKKIK